MQTNKDNPSSPSEKSELEQRARELENGVGSVLSFLGDSSSPSMLAFLAKEMGLEKDEEGDWNIYSYAEAIHRQDSENAHVRAQLVNRVFGDIFEELSEATPKQLKENERIIQLLQETYDSVMLPLAQHLVTVDEFFSEAYPIFPDNVPLWRKAAFLSLVAYVYQRHPEAKTNLHEWLKKASGRNDDVAIEKGLFETYKDFMSGREDF